MPDIIWWVLYTVLDLHVCVITIATAASSELFSALGRRTTCQGKRRANDSLHAMYMRKRAMSIFRFKITLAMSSMHRRSGLSF